MSHKVAYGVGGEFTGNLDYIKSVGVIDATMVGHGTDHVSQDFVNQCKARGMSPLYNGGNDSVPTASGKDAASVYQMLANMGYEAAGGESTQAWEMIEAQKHITFINYGGEGISPNQDSFGNLGFQAGGAHGVVSWVESYNFPAQLVPDDCVNAMIHAAKAGCIEVGILIGGWMPVEAQSYISMANRFEAAGFTIGKFDIWWGINTSMDSTVQKWAGVIQALQQYWPADMRDLATRLASGGTHPSGGGGGGVSAIDWTPAYELILDD